MLCRYDLASGQIEQVAHQLGLMAVLDAENLAVVKRRSVAGVFNLKTRTFSVFPNVAFFRGGQRDRALVHLKEGEARATAITFGKKSK